MPRDRVRGAANYHFYWTWRPILASRGAVKYWLPRGKKGWENTESQNQSKVTTTNTLSSCEPVYEQSCNRCLFSFFPGNLPRRDSMLSRQKELEEVHRGMSITNWNSWKWFANDLNKLVFFCKRSNTIQQFKWFKPNLNKLKNKNIAPAQIYLVQNHPEVWSPLPRCLHGIFMILT